MSSDGSTWRRSDRDDSPYFHRYCTLNPFNTAAPPELIAFAESSPMGRTIGRLFGYALRHAQLLVILAGTAIVAWGWWSPTVGGIGALIGNIVGERTLLLLADLGLWAVIVLLVTTLLTADADLRGEMYTTAVVFEVATALVVYGVGAVLLAGTVYTFWLVTVTRPAQLEPNVVYASGYLLLLYVTGPLVYDGMVRTQHLFARLPTTSLVPTHEQLDAVNQPAETATRIRASYRTFRRRQQRLLGSAVGRVPTAVVIALLVVGQFVVVYAVSGGPFGLLAANFRPTHLLAPTVVFTVLTNVVTVVVAVQFFVIIRSLNHLLSTPDRDTWVDADSPPDAPPLFYDPAHNDGAGGFGDLGRFATRVNVLLVIAGLYLIYRLRVQGSRDPLVTGAATTLDHSVETLVWVFSYVTPIVLYAVVMLVWVYFSFWRLHKRMIRGKMTQLRQERDEEGLREDLNRFEQDLEKFEKYSHAPEWPVSNFFLASILTADALSILLSVASIAL